MRRRRKNVMNASEKGSVLPKTKKHIIAKNYLFLHALLLLYSFGAICSKLAAGEAFLSVRFCIFYGLVLGNLFIYAILWQQILKRLPLTTAFANKAITIVWGLLWGKLFFGEKITLPKLLGSLVIFVGICLVVTEQNE